MTVMESGHQFSEIAALVGDKCRSMMLWHLLDGRAYTATELSLCADTSPQSGSNHLSKLVDAHILAVEKQGRHRYYRFANSDIAHAIESMASLVPSNQEKKITTENKGIFYARTCYDHIAGKLGVEIAGSLIKKGIINADKKQYAVTRDGNNWFQSLGINIQELRSSKRSFARPCLDWSERKHHLAGALGAALLNSMLKNDWIRRMRNSREIIVTAKGKTEFQKKLGIEIK